MKRNMQRLAALVVAGGTLLVGMQVPALADDGGPRHLFQKGYPDAVSCEYAGRYYQSYYGWPNYECVYEQGAYDMYYYV